jgi:hypothetical protein
MESTGSLSHSHEPTTGPYPRPLGKQEELVSKIELLGFILPNLMMIIYMKQSKWK